MFCHKCGTQIADGAGFCHKCGTKVVYEEVVKQQPADTPVPVDEPQQTGGTRLEPAITKDQPLSNATFEPESDNLNQAPTDELTHEKEPSKFKKWWGTASKPKKILAVLGGLLVGGFALYLLVAFLREFGYLLFGIAVIGGFIITITTGSEKEKIETRKTIVQMVIGIGIIIVISLVVVLKPDFVSNIFQPGANVRNAYLTQYSDTVTIEDAFDNFFDNGKWGTYKENDYSYVTFTGACEYLGERADVKITFKITGENFLVDHLDVNGTMQNDLILYGLLAKVYEDY